MERVENLAPYPNSYTRCAVPNTYLDSSIFLLGPCLSAITPCFTAWVALTPFASDGSKPLANKRDFVGGRRPPGGTKFAQAYNQKGTESRKDGHDMRQVAGRWVITKKRFRKNDYIATLFMVFIVAIWTFAFYVDRLGSIDILR